MKPYRIYCLIQTLVILRIYRHDPDRQSMYCVLRKPQYTSFMFTGPIRTPPPIHPCPVMLRRYWNTTIEPTKNESDTPEGATFILCLQSPADQGHLVLRCPL